MLFTKTGFKKACKFLVVVEIFSFCLGLFLFWLNGNEFERGSSLTTTVAVCLFLPLTIWLLILPAICDFFDDVWG